jgi:hypothetical protein
MSLVCVEEARRYIALFRRHTLPGASHVQTSTGRFIFLDRMSDEDALFVAAQFQKMEIEAARRRKVPLQ